ncbi:hypothetical protein GC102_37605 [Paenibacillus sp. LMG 31460]|uniref:GNAT family N-acetyltransferase n=1 Tax=Paenibacillus germinis TaxID=2654979 RepID=A0ABX1ZGP3_9BACL|nr:hypothetical protein [Paenibacillus germinis]NOU91401.1 hypothetical protein [Paenibacillus germinis]
MKADNLPFEDYLIDTDDEEVIWIKNRAFVIRPATDDDIERIGKGIPPLTEIENTYSRSRDSS